ncbi:MAG: trypsin-like peptidase domain-containing protein [Planctomycetota bacterium]|jgi:serine protease Do
MRILSAVYAAVALLGVTWGAAAEEPPQERALRRTPVVEVFENCRDAVVNISSTEVVQVRDPFDRLFEGFFERPFRTRPRQYKRTSIGSGFVIHPGGYIVTNAHVVARSTASTVTFADGREFETQVVASDRDHDVAVLKIESTEPLATLRFGRSADLMIGETVVAIGNPLGYQHTVTAGVVSAVKRDLEFSGELVLSGLIQTDASINPGNSGGPLLNVLGELIGVNTAIRGDAQNIGFAIPVDELRSLLPDLLDVERRYRIQSGMKLGNAATPRVESVQPGSPADAAGIRVGDVLSEVDGLPLRESVDFHIALIGRAPGDRLRLKLMRDARPVATSLELEARPRPDATNIARRRLGVELTSLPQDLARELRLPRGAGLAIVDVEPGSPADRIGMKRYDVLVGVGRYHPATLEELGPLLEFVRSGDQITVSYLRVKPPEIIRYRATLRAR